jgi:hypothetical protein
MAFSIPDRAVPMLSTGLVALAFLVPGAARAQHPANSIGNFRAVNVSSAELRVIVDYTLAGAPDDAEVAIHATPVESGGVFDPRTVDVEELPLRRGTGSATLSISKRAEGREFTSVGVRVCMSTAERALFCKDFAHVKTWTNTGPVAGGPTPAVPRATCSISGEVSGQLRWSVPGGDHGGATMIFTMREVLLMAPGANAPRRATLQGGRYTFPHLPAGVVYRIVPSNFLAEPAERRVSCRPDTRHRGRDFRIVGPPRQG